MSSETEEAVETAAERLTRWAQSLRRTSDATMAEAEQHGASWEYYDLSMSSAAAQLNQAIAFEETARTGV